VSAAMAMAMQMQLQHRWRSSWPWTATPGDAPSTSYPPQHQGQSPATKPSRQRLGVNLRRLLDRETGLTMPSAAVQDNAQVWMPSPPPVDKPRANYNAASLAYLGDAIYEVYVRRHFLMPPQTIDSYNKRVMAVVCCEAQDAMLKGLLKDTFLTEEERDVVRWGKNIETGQRRASRRAGAATYSSASALETLVSFQSLVLIYPLSSLYTMVFQMLIMLILLIFENVDPNVQVMWLHMQIGYLYLTNQSRLEELMAKIGFSVDSSCLLAGFGLQTTVNANPPS
jgi:ribonuclease-3 family protein